MSADRMKILVTGAAGQLGRRLVKCLAREGYPVRAHFRTPESAARFCPDGIEAVVGDLRQDDWMPAAVAGCDTIIHGAARISLRQVDPTLMDNINVGGTVRLLEKARDAGVKRFIHVSSIAAVGASEDGQPLDETANYNLGQYGIPYFDTKRRAEELALEANRPGFDVIVVNPAIMISLPDRNTARRKLDQLPSRLPFYFNFGLNLVQTEDVVDGIIGAIGNGQPGQRYILGGANISSDKLLALVETYLGIKRPWLKIPYPAVYATGILFDMVGWLKRLPGSAWPLRFGSPRFGSPRFGRHLARLARLRFYYDSGKARLELGYFPRSPESTLECLLSASICAEPDKLPA